MSERSEEIEHPRSQQDFGIPEAERILENCIGDGEDVFTMLDVANLAGVTADD